MRAELVAKEGSLAFLSAKAEVNFKNFCHQSANSAIIRDNAIAIKFDFL